VWRLPGAALDYVGSAVNRAARLCDSAAPWQARAATDAGDALLYLTLRPIAGA
jgi:class 3 adenylate cyclase